MGSFKRLLAGAICVIFLWLLLLAWLLSRYATHTSRPKTQRYTRLASQEEYTVDDKPPPRRFGVRRDPGKIPSDPQAVTFVEGWDLSTSLPPPKTKPTFTEMQPSNGKIAVITLHDGIARYNSIVSLSLENKERYASLHHYDFFVDNDFYAEDNPLLRRPLAWAKLIVAKHHLMEGYDWVMWVDIDTLFMNMSLPIERLTDNNFDLIITKDGPGGVNSGVFLIKRSQWSIDFLTHCWNMEDLAMIDKSVYEQRAMKRVVALIGPEVEREHIKYLPQREMNCYTKFHPPQFALWQPGDFILHFAGCRYHSECKSKFDHHFRNMYNWGLERWPKVNQSSTPSDG